MQSKTIIKNQLLSCYFHFKLLKPVSKWGVLFNKWEKFLRFIFLLLFFCFVLFFINTYVAQKNHSIFANETSKTLAAEKLS